MSSVRRQNAAVRKAAAVIVAAMMLLSGCGTGGAGDGGGTGAVLRVGTTDPVSSFNPFMAMTISAADAINAVYPTLLDISFDEDKGYQAAPSLAESWEVAEDGKQITFTIRDDAVWSDGEPITAADAAWTVNTIIKFKDGPAGQLSSYIEGMREASAPDDTTLVIDYETAQQNTLILIASGLSILPEHVWGAQAEGDGRGLRTFQPEQGGMISGGPFTLKKFDKRGTTVYERFDDFFGARSNADAVALSYYTGADAMMQDFRSGKLDYVERLSANSVKTVEETPGATLAPAASEMQADLFFNANPRKLRNRELLDPRVRTAMTMCVDREEIREVVFGGFANPVETLVGTLEGSFYNDALEREYDCEKANRTLDELGYDRGADGIRVAPATTGEYAQEAHPMSYEAVTRSSGNQPYNEDRTVAIIREDFEALGIELEQRAVGDDAATWTFITGDDCDPGSSKGYADFDMSVSGSYAEIDPLDTLSGELKQTWCAWNFTGTDDPEYEELYQQANAEQDPEKRKDLILEMQEVYFDSSATFALAEPENITAHSNAWTDFPSPEVSRNNSRLYTDPRPTN